MNEHEQQDPMRHYDFVEEDLSALLDRLKEALGNPHGPVVEFRVYENEWDGTWWAAVYCQEGADLPFLREDA